MKKTASVFLILLTVSNALRAQAADSSGTCVTNSLGFKSLTYTEADVAVEYVKALNARAADLSGTCLTNPPDFKSLTYTQANIAVKYAERSILGTLAKPICPEYITNLVLQIQSDELKTDNKVLAIYLLGILRPSNTNAIEVLIRLVDLKALRFDAKTTLRRWGEYPAQEALINIRIPALAPTITHLHSETNPLRRRLLCDVVRCIEGWEGGMKHLRKLASEEADAERRKNLERSVEALEKLPH